MTDKTPRAEKTREKESRRRPWSPPSSLDAPPHPKGFLIVGSVKLLWDMMIEKTLMLAFAKGLN